MKYILFTGKHCKSCPGMKASLHKAGIKFDEVSTDAESGAMMSGLYHVRALPTLVITKHGKPLESFPGALPMATIMKIKDKYK